MKSHISSGIHTEHHEDLFFSSFSPPKQKYQWIEESCIFEKKTGKQVPLPQSDAYIGSSLSARLVGWCLRVVIVIFCLFLSKVFILQIIHGNDYLALAEGNRQRIIPIPAERGLVYDREMLPLTKNIPRFSLAIVPQDLPRDSNEREHVVRALAGIIGGEEGSIRKTLEEYGSYSYESIVIEENLEYEQALSLHIAASELPGIHIERGSKRLYFYTTPSSTMEGVDFFASSLSHILGYEGKLNREELDQLYPKGYLPSDTIGKTGVEKTYESLLRGIYGKRRIEVNVLGKEQAVLAEQPPVPGSHLVLTVDLAIQNKLQEILERHLKENEKSRTAAIAIDPRNGEILGLVSLPTFDNNDFSGGIEYEKYQRYLSDKNNPLFNRAIAGTYPSGSTIKPVLASAALNEHIITPETSILSVGGIWVSRWFFPDWLSGGHGRTNVRKSLAESVNTFYYYIGGGYGDVVGLGVDRIASYLKRFGFSKKLGIDIPGEVDGFIPSPSWKQETKGEQWYIGDTYNLSIGQGDLLVTPLQIASMTATIANKGTLYEPHIVTMSIDPVSKEETLIAPTVIASHVIEEDVLETVGLGMRDCVLFGSCRRLASLPFSVAGKTGTAQWSSTKENHAWFTSFAPFDVPEIVLTVLVEEGGEGSAIAVPVADEFYRWWGVYKKTK